jgi:hypothetical protein
MAAYRIRGLAKLISSLLALCRVIDAFAPTIRQFVPTESLTAYDAALSAIKAACDTLRAIEYLDTAMGTNAPWGS